MKRLSIYIGIVAVLALVLLSGCGYFNTFYNARKKFGEAEHETRAAEKQAQRQQRQQGGQQQNNPSNPPQQGGAPPGGAAGQSGAATDKYRKVIETSSKLLEDHPKSRWADDALFIMGVSYFRLGDLPRAERKFTELITLFPKSSLIPEATVWKARTLAQQKKSEEAIELLQTGLDLMKPGPEKAAALSLMGSLCYNLKRYSDAADYYKQSTKLRQPRTAYVNALFNYAQAQFALSKFEEARDAYAEVARTTNDTPQAYDAAIRGSECEVELKNFDKARAMLERLKSGEQFLDYSEDIPLELAHLAVRTGRVDDGMKLYQDYVADHSNGERRGLAFYRLAVIQRDQRADLPTAKALLDSSLRTGASRQIADSARAALEQLSKGLLVMDRIRTLQTSIRNLEAQMDSAGVPAEARTPAALLAYEDSVRKRESEVKPSRTTLLAEAARTATPDSTRVTVKPEAHSAVSRAQTRVDSVNHKATLPDSLATPVSADSTTKPSNPDTTRNGNRHSMRGFRSTSESQGGTPPDSLQRPLPADSLPRQHVMPPVPMPVAPGMSARPAPVPATLDSVSHAPMPLDSAAHDSTRRVQAPPPQASPRDSVAASPSHNPTDVLKTQLLSAERELQLAYLHTAEFYAHSLSEQDSALVYYRLAAVSPVNASVYWRANLYLGNLLSPKANPSKADSVKADSVAVKKDSLKTDSLSGEATLHFLAVVHADSVPIPAANAARAALKMPLIETPVPTQVVALKEAEAANFSGNAPADSVIGLYSRVITMDSTSKEGKKALFAKAVLLENKLRRYDQARSVYEHLLALSPDSEVAIIARGKLATPDSGSVFNMTDAELSGKRESVETLFDSKQDESGWPPTEETLRGRHFH